VAATTALTALAIAPAASAAEVAQVTETFAAEPADAAARTTFRSAGAPRTVSPMATGRWTAKATRKNTRGGRQTLFTYCNHRLVVLQRRPRAGAVNPSR
jgi:hypothetical protein